MTITSPPAQGFRVSVRSETLTLGALDSVESLAEAREQLAVMRHIHPQSTIQTFESTTDDGLGRWRDVSDDDLDRIADARAALVLAGILQRDMPRITWLLQDHKPGQLVGEAYEREQVEAYARLLGVVAADTGTTYRNFVASAVFEGVEVKVSCHLRSEQPAEVTA